MSLAILRRCPTRPFTTETAPFTPRPFHAESNAQTNALPYQTRHTEWFAFRFFVVAKPLSLTPTHCGCEERNIPADNNKYKKNNPKDPPKAHTKCPLSSICSLRQLGALSRTIVVPSQPIPNHQNATSFLVLLALLFNR